jgi:hypothetical protein
MRLYTIQCTVKFIWLADFVFLLYVAQSRQSARLFLQSSELELPTPSPAGQCVLPLVPGGGTHSLAGEGVWGVPIRTKGQILWYSRFVYVLCGVWTVDTPFLTLSLCSSPTFLYCTHTHSLHSLALHSKQLTLNVYLHQLVRIYFTACIARNIEVHYLVLTFKVCTHNSQQ